MSGHRGGSFFPEGARVRSIARRWRKTCPDFGVLKNGMALGLERTFLGFLCLLLSACAERSKPLPPPLAAEPGVKAKGVEAPAPLDGARELVAPDKAREARVVVRLPRPPFAYQLEQTLDVPEAPPPRLVEVAKSKISIVDEAGWFRANKLSPLGEELTQTARQELEQQGVPLSIEGARLARRLRHEDHEILLYDAPEQRGRYLLVLRADKRFGPFDFSSYRDAPNAPEAFTEAETLWAQAREGVLFVSHAHLTYAKSSAGQNAYLSALSLEDGQLLWRSQPLVANSRECALLSAHVVCGYGFTAEPDFLYLLSAANGLVVKKIPVKSGPEHILRSGNQLFVRTYDTGYRFEL